MQKPLEGIRVLDLTNVLAGPFCGHQLAHMGADIIKVEAVGRGDLARQLGADPALNAAGMGVSYLAQNAGKRSVTLNLKAEAGKALFHRLLETADVLVENFRPGVMDRLGLGYDALKAVRPELIYCAVSGFGQEGPWAGRPAYDQIVQGMSGVMSVTGEAGSTPLRVGYPVADTVGGLTAAFAVCAALNAKERGAFIDVSMLESVLSTMGWAVSNYLIAGVEPAPHGNENVTSAPSAAYQTAEGMLNIAANKEEQWVLLVEHLGLEALMERPEYASRDERKRHRAALRAELEPVLAQKPATVWEAELNAIGVPAGAVLTVPQVLAEAQVAERGFLTRYDDVPGVDRPVHIATTGVKIDGVAPSVAAPPEALGQSNDAVWGDLGLSPEEIDGLRAEGVI